MWVLQLRNNRKVNRVSLFRLIMAIYTAIRHIIGRLVLVLLIMLYITKLLSIFKKLLYNHYLHMYGSRIEFGDLGMILTYSLIYFSVLFLSFVFVCFMVLGMESKGFWEEKIQSLKPPFLFFFFLLFPHSFFFSFGLKSIKNIQII